jgi:hypothetical protein
MTVDAVSGTGPIKSSFITDTSRFVAPAIRVRTATTFQVFGLNSQTPAHPETFACDLKNKILGPKQQINFRLRNESISRYI